MTNAPSGAFEAGLYNGYLELAQAEYDEGDYTDSDYFAMKAQQLAGGTLAKPTEMTERDIPTGAAAELTEARADLTAALAAGAAISHAVPAAEAQVAFDCWMQEQEENLQPADITACRDRFIAAMDKIMPMAPLPEIVILFPLDSAKVPQAAIDELAAAAGDAADSGYSSVTVEGHADRSGPAEYNMKLARERVTNVVRLINDLGVPVDRIMAESYGEARPAKPTADGVTEPVNRRVTVTFSQ